MMRYESDLTMLINSVQQESLVEVSNRHNLSAIAAIGWFKVKLHLLFAIP